MSAEANPKPDPDPDPEVNTLPEREVDMFAEAWREFQAHRSFIKASSKLEGVKEVVYDEDHLKKIVRNLVKYRPANVRIWIGSEENGETQEKVIDSSLLACQGLAEGASTLLFEDEDINSALLRYEIDAAVGLTANETRPASIVAYNAAHKDRPLDINITDVSLDSPSVHVVARNVVDGNEIFDQYEGDTSYLNGLNDKASATFTIRESLKGKGYTVHITKELPGQERVPGLDVQIGMLLLKQLGLPPEAAEDLGDMGPVHKDIKNVSTGDAF